MKIQLIYSKVDVALKHIIEARTLFLVKEGKMKFVPEQADSALFLLSPDSLNDVFCYQAFITARYYNRLVMPVLMKYCLDSTNKFKDVLNLTWDGHHIPSTGNYIYNPDGSFRSCNYPTLDKAWEITIKDIRHFIETKQS